MKFLFASLLCLSLFPFSAWAEPVMDGSWVLPNSTKTIDVFMLGVELDVRDPIQKATTGFYPFSSEIIEASQGVSANFIGGSDLCRATTRVASGDLKQLVLVQAYRSKVSYSLGVLCPLASDVSSFDEPYAYTQIVLTLQDDGTLKKVTTKMTLNEEAPDLTVDEMLDANITQDNEMVRNYVASELAKGDYSDVTITEEVFVKDNSVKGKM